ncbi:hypothetical protein MPSEU_000932200 [Mayamaea pseudoterrestris]|nr:hypothetical protein MPSEU_000932200 [Mayamaea pseudoterrestris]
MPPSIHFDDQKGGTASVDYLLTARLDQHDVTVTKPVTVVGAPCRDIKEMPNVQEPSAIPLKSFGILDQGRFLVATKICNTHIAKGERLKCSLSVRNESKIELERVDLQLVETVEWRANGHEKQQMTTIASLQDLTLPGSFTRPTTHPEHGKDIGPSTYAELMAQLTWKRNWYDLKVPPCTIESYTGTLLTVKHALNVLVFLKGRLQHEIVATTADVQIFDEPLSGESGHLQNNHHIKAEASEEIARTKWPHDANAVAGNLETAPDVPTISEGATISMQT